MFSMPGAPVPEILSSHVPHIRVRKARPDDAHDIVRVACSVGNSTRDPSLGFLVDNYASDPLRYRDEFVRKAIELEFFYVAETKRVIGFLMAYDRDRWLKMVPDWLSTTHWHPEFRHRDVGRFVVIDKTAVMAGMTGQGIGSMLYDRLLADLRLNSIEDIFAETVIAPTPNYASLEFRRKQDYRLVGVRYERVEANTYTSLVYRKRVVST